MRPHPRQRLRGDPRAVGLAERIEDAVDVGRQLFKRPPLLTRVLGPVFALALPEPRPERQRGLHGASLRHRHGHETSAGFSSNIAKSSLSLSPAVAPPPLAFALVAVDDDDEGYLTSATWSADLGGGGLLATVPFAPVRFPGGGRRGRGRSSVPSAASGGNRRTYVAATPTYRASCAASAFSYFSRHASFASCLSVTFRNLNVKPATFSPARAPRLADATAVFNSPTRPSPASLFPSYAGPAMGNSSAAEENRSASSNRSCTTVASISSRNRFSANASIFAVLASSPPVVVRDVQVHEIAQRRVYRVVVAVRAAARFRKVRRLRPTLKRAQVLVYPPHAVLPRPHVSRRDAILRDGGLVPERPRADLDRELVRAEETLHGPFHERVIVVRAQHAAPRVLHVHPELVIGLVAPLVGRKRVLEVAEVERPPGGARDVQEEEEVVGRIVRVRLRLRPIRVRVSRGDARRVPPLLRLDPAVYQRVAARGVGRRRRGRVGRRDARDGRRRGGLARGRRRRRPRVGRSRRAIATDVGVGVERRSRRRRRRRRRRGVVAAGLVLFRAAQRRVLLDEPAPRAIRRRRDRRELRRRFERRGGPRRGRRDPRPARGAELERGAAAALVPRQDDDEDGDEEARAQLRGVRPRARHGDCPRDERAPRFRRPVVVEES
eukprot:31267-Pelagococcus_subviridis.AAC.11